MRRAVHLLGKAFRETGQALDRLGLTVAENELYKETFSRHRPVMNLFDKVIYSCLNFLVVINLEYYQYIFLLV